MEIYQEIGKQLTKSIKEKNESQRDILRYLKGEIERASISERKKITDDFCIGILKRMIKQSEDTKKFSEKFNRHLSAKLSVEEIKIYKSFLPAEMSEEDIRLMIGKVIVETGAKTKKDFGKVMKTLKKNLPGQDMKLISHILNKELN